MLISLSGIKKLNNLKELYLAHNRITEIEHLASCENLIILDSSYNKLQNFQAIAGIEELKSLKILNLEGNGIVKQLGFKENITTLIPSITNLNPKNVEKFSKFQAQVHSFHEKKIFKKSDSMKIKYKK